MPTPYKIKAVKPEPSQWSGAYGPMVTYSMMLEGHDVPVDINKKPESPAPKAGDELFGDITRTEHGDKFKAVQRPDAGGFKGGGGSKPQADPFTMYLSYAKDLAVASIEHGTGGKLTFNEEVYEVALAAVEAGGAQLYASRPDAPKEAVTPDVVHEVPDEPVDLSQIDAVFGGSEPVEEAPWPPKT